MPIALMIALTLGLAPFLARADTIHGCVNQKSGKLRIVGVTGQCKKNEAPISWNSEGPQGPAGPQGPEGPQ